MTSRTGASRASELSHALPGAWERILARPRSDGIDLRVGEPGDERTVLGLLDEAVMWLNARGITQQWGTTAFSASPQRVEAAQRWVSDGGTILATTCQDRPAGALVLGDAPAYVPPAETPEVYVVLLVASRDPSARGVGALLLGLARDVAAHLGVPRLRVDCYAGGDQALVRFYEANGFTRAAPISVDGWPGQVLEQHVPASTTART